VAKIQFFKADEVPFIEAGHGEGASRQHHNTGDSLHLFEVRLPPNRKVDLHAHQEDEIIHVVAGQMTVGNQLLKAGDSVFISGMTLYGLQAGPDGVSFINFRRQFDLTYYTNEEFLEYRKLDEAGRAAMDAQILARQKAIARWDD
jgi:hypothetical protein